MGILTQQQRDECTASINDTNPKTKLWSSTITILNLLLLRDSNDPRFKGSDWPQRRLVRDALRSADPREYIFTATNDGPDRRRQEAEALSKLPTEKMSTAEIASELNVSTKTAVERLEGAQRLTRGSVDEVRDSPMVTISGLFLTPLAKLAVIQIHNAPGISVPAILLGSEKCEFDAGQAGVSTAPLVAFRKALTDTVNTLPPLPLVVPNIAIAEACFLDHLRSALAAKPIERASTDPDEGCEPLTFGILEYPGGPLYRGKVEDVLNAHGVLVIDTMPRDFPARVEEVMTSPHLLAMGIGFFPDLPEWCRILEDTDFGSLGWTEDHANFRPLWETLPQSRLHQLHRRLRSERKAERQDLQMFGGSEEYSEPNVLRTSLGKKMERVDGDLKFIRSDDIVAGDADWVFFKTAGIADQLLERVGSSEFADEILHARDLLKKTKVDGAGFNTLLNWHDDPHVVCAALQVLAAQSGLHKHLVVGVALTQFDEGRLVGSRSTESIGHFAEYLASLCEGVKAAVKRGLIDQQKRKPSDDGPQVFPEHVERDIATFARNAARDLLLIALRYARSAFLEASAASGHEILALGQMLKDQADVSLQDIPPDAPLRSFWPPALRVSLHSLIHAYQTAEAFSAERKGTTSLDKQLGVGGRSTFHESVGAKTKTLIRDPEEVLLVIKEVMRTDRHQTDKEKWEPLEFDRRNLTAMALDCAEALSGWELDELLAALPKVIRNEVVFN